MLRGCKHTHFDHYNLFSYPQFLFSSFKHWFKKLTLVQIIALTERWTRPVSRWYRLPASIYALETQCRCLPVTTGSCFCWAPMEVVWLTSIDTKTCPERMDSQLVIHTELEGWTGLCLHSCYISRPVVLQQAGLALAKDVAVSGT